MRTKITPPPLNARTLSRPRVLQLLKKALEYRLTILQTGAGYGKSTALSSLVREVSPVIWYQVYEEDNNPLVFLLHLCHATLLALPDISGIPLASLDDWDETQGPLAWREVVDDFINCLSSNLEQPVLFILDDAHLVTENGEVVHILDRLISRAPAKLHILLSGRPPITLPTLSRLRAQGDVLSLDQATLSFNSTEITALFASQYGIELSTEEVDALIAYTEGWAIALQLTWQSIRNQSLSALDFPKHLQIDKNLPEQLGASWNSGSDALDTLFEILAREVFERQPTDVRKFLLVTATLRELIPEACDSLRNSSDSAAMLSYLKRQDLFVVEGAGSVLRYHHIFHHFLGQQSSLEQRLAWNKLAAGYFLKHNHPETALFHLMRANAWAMMADSLDEYIVSLPGSGRLEALTVYINRLPPEILQQHPGLIFALGEIARQHSRFEEALGWYSQSETAWRTLGKPDGIARALRGQSRVYLDTVNPSKAEELLEKSIRLSDGVEDIESQVRLFELLAENKLNAGHVAEAEHLQQRADSLRLEGPSDDQLLFRVWLRTGRLAEAREALEKRASAEKQQPVQTPRAHRETMLLLSLIYSFMGLGKQAYQTALEGKQRGEDLKAPFVTAVGHIRQGHALMLQGDTENYIKAQEQYEKSIEISRTLSISRLLVESGWGLCRSFGYVGDLTKAQQHAQEAIEIANQAGDEWIASLVRLTMGASLSLAARYEAAEQWLNRAVAGFQECSDPFGRSAARLWLSVGYFRQRQFERLAQVLPEVLATCRSKDYDFLFTRPSFIGPPDERVLVPLLLYARQNNWETAYVGKLLDRLGLSKLDLHPGYRLKVQTFGEFQVWRGSDLIPANGWRREKARQLFQVLLTFRQTALEREQICELLWPETDPVTAQRNFKTTLNTLFQVLEPEREPGAESAFILREGSTYSLRPGADLWLDAEQFMKSVREVRTSRQNNKSNPQRDEIARLENTIRLYGGNYLPDVLYDPWVVEKRDKFAADFLEISDRLVGLLLTEGQYAEAINLSQRVLIQDNCWERAYRHLMLAYDKLGDHGQVGRIYQRCVQTLRDELDVSPAPETEKLYQTLIMNI
ncbi:MAG: BTAD domain-containing putative transcriptional regulator [Chloroflexota bacterium]